MALPKPMPIVVSARIAPTSTRAERRIGELMEDERKAGKLAKGTCGKVQRGMKGATGGSRADPPVSALASRGVGKHLADRARKLAAMTITGSTP